MIGGLILEKCIANKDVTKISLINRKPSGLTDPKLYECIHANFLDFSAVGDVFQSQDICFYCLGVYTGQVPSEEFKRITYEYTKAFADALYQKSPAARFCFLSGEGADPSEKSRILFAREKGRAENYLLGLNFSKTYLFRPGYIYPVKPRKEPNLMYKLLRIFYKPLRLIYPNLGVESEKLATKMFEVGLFGGDKIIYHNRDIRE